MLMVFSRDRQKLLRCFSFFSARDDFSRTPSTQRSYFVSCGQLGGKSRIGGEVREKATSLDRAKADNSGPGREAQATSRYTNLPNRT